ncbi:MAG: FkbM family methyltransferase [Planctomycetota bacterium]|nr:FkbM family methyltransferase [Planctomycetota bacterium]
MTDLSTLDVVLGDRFAKRQVLVKLDVEGSEYAVLQGAARLLAAANRPTWFLEICFDEFHPGQVNPSFRKTFELFWSHGYEVRTADEREKVTVPADIDRWLEESRRDVNGINCVAEPLGEPGQGSGT